MKMPSTVDRVPDHTADEVNARIARKTLESIRCHAAKGPAAIERRLQELDREWDIERTLEANAAGVSLIGTALGFCVHKAFFALPGAVAAFGLQHALQGWCPPLPFFRRLGVRTQSEIEYERYALKAIRGDFGSAYENPQMEMMSIEVVGGMAPR